jgi:hypothetical protein
MISLAGGATDTESYMAVEVATSRSWESGCGPRGSWPGTRLTRVGVLPVGPRLSVSRSGCFGGEPPTRQADGEMSISRTLMQVVVRGGRNSGIGRMDPDRIFRAAPTASMLD